MNMPPIVSPQEWEAARQELLVKEKELTRSRDALAAERRRMPRMAVEKDYRFEGRAARRACTTCLTGAVNWSSTASSSSPARPAGRSAAAMAAR
jgi:predicted dithiol-disulfide oxidoreductase (DUF899 family)